MKIVNCPLSVVRGYLSINETMVTTEKGQPTKDNRP
jgi:hypothetical protein